MADGLPEIYLMRHCKTAWNREGRIQGSIDMPLCPEGVAEAASVLRSIQAFRFERIVSSPYRRARQTAGVLAKGLAIPMETLDDLRELDHGDWEGQRIETLMQTPASPYAAWFRDPSGNRIPGGSETVCEAQTRVVEAVKDTARRYAKGRILVVLHKHIRALLNCHLNGRRLAAFGLFVQDSITPQKIAAAQLQRLFAEFEETIENHP